MNKKIPKYGSDIVVDILKKHNIKFVSFNPGASFRGLHDSIVNDKDKNKLTAIMCLHEEISVAIAHGYAKATNSIMPVLLHSNVGLQHASMAIFNAWSDRVALLLIGANGPRDTSKRRPWIDWVHSTNDQHSIIKDYVKWLDVPFDTQGVTDALYRGIKLSLTSPKAPVYIELDAVFQEEPVENFALENPIRFLPPKSPNANINDLQNITNLILDSNFPLIVADYAGRDNDVLGLITKISEELSIGVWDCGSSLNFPTKHFLNITGKDKSLFEKCDFILALDVKDLYGTVSESEGNRVYKSRLNSNAKIAHITMSDFLVDKWSADYQKLMPVDFPISSNPAASLEQIWSLLSKKKLGKSTLNKIKVRKSLLKTIDAKYRRSWNKKMNEYSKFPALTLPNLLNIVWENIKDFDWVLTNNGNSNIKNWVRKIWDIRDPKSYMGGSSGVGLGYGLGASIGVSLAHKDNAKLCIDIQPDGDFLYTPQAIWTAVKNRIPLLIVVINNRSYHNSENHALEVAKNRERQSFDTLAGTKITNPDINFSQLAKSMGAIGYGPICNKSDLKKILPIAISQVKNKKKFVVLDVITKEI